MLKFLFIFLLIPGLSWGEYLNLKEEITTLNLALPFNVFKRNNNQKSNLVEPRGIEPLTSTLPA